MLTNEKFFQKIENVDYISNFFRYKLYDKKNNIYLLTTDDGNFIFTNRNSLLQLKRGKIINKNIFNKFLEKGFIITNENIEKIILKTRKKYFSLFDPVSLNIIVPSSRCTQNCSYCFASPDKLTADKSRTEMTIETAKKTIDFIFSYPAKATTLEYTGGEALLNFEVVKFMVLYAKKKNEKINRSLRQTIVTNLSLMTDEIADFLIDNQVTICTSLDGPQNVHDKNRFILGKNLVKIGTHKKVVYWIDRINQKYKKIKIPLQVNALITTTAYSLKYYKEIIDEYVKYDLKLVDLRMLMNIGRAVSNNELKYEYKKFVDFYKKSIEYIDELQQKGIKINDRMRELFNIMILENKPIFHIDFENPWGAARNSLTYFSNGDIYANHEAIGKEEFLLGNVKKDKYGDIFKKKETSFTILSSLLENNFVCDKCVFKPYCSTSPIENFYTFKKFNVDLRKTSKHFETIFHTKRVFDKLLEKVKKEENYLN